MDEFSGPVVLYVADLADIINRHRHTVSLFTRLSMTRSFTGLHCCREDITTAATRLNECIVDVGRWQ